VFLPAHLLIHLIVSFVSIVPQAKHFPPGGLLRRFGGVIFIISKPGGWRRRGGRTRCRLSGTLSQVQRAPVQMPANSRLGRPPILLPVIGTYARRLKVQIAFEHVFQEKMAGRDLGPGSLLCFLELALGFNACASLLDECLLLLARTYQQTNRKGLKMRNKD
jgi:hypothetical protein